MKNLKKLFILASLFTVSSSAFAIEGFLHDSFFAICSHIKDFSDIAIRENVVDGRAVAASPMDLQVGDIFIDVDGNAKKVVKITRTKNNITIDTETPEPQEVFDIITIPKQTADFKAAVDERFAEENQNNRTLTLSNEASDNNDRELTNANKKLLDGLIPEPDGKVSLTFSPVFSPIGSKSFAQGLLDSCSKVINDPASSKEEVDDMKNVKQQIDNKFANAKAKPSVKITPEVRWKTHQDETVYEFSYVKTGVDTHGTWKFWKWTTYYEPGYYDFHWLKDTEWGIGIDVAGGLTGNVLLTVPGLAVGSTAFGPYAGVYLDLSASAMLSASYYYYSRTAKYTESFSNFNAVFIPSNERAESFEWAPSAHQVDLLFNGNASIGPALKAGLVAFGMRLVEVYAGGGVKFDGSVGAVWTHKNNDSDNYTKLCNQLNKDISRTSGNVNAALVKFRDRVVADNPVTAGTSKWSKTWNNYTNGWQFLGKAQLSLYGKIDLKMFQDRVSFNLFNINYTFWNATGDGKPSAGYSSPWGSKKL